MDKKSLKLLKEFESILIKDQEEIIDSLSTRVAQLIQSKNGKIIVLGTGVGLVH